MDMSAEPAEGLEEELVRQLVDRARAEGLKLTGRAACLGRLTKVVVESALEGEMDDHLGYGKHDAVGRNGGNSRNGTRSKTLVTEAGPVEIEVPRDRESAFEPVIVGKRQRRLSGIDDLVISLPCRARILGCGLDLRVQGHPRDHAAILYSLVSPPRTALRRTW